MTVVMPTGVGKTLVAVLFSEALVEKGLRVLVLEPTRILVEQTGEYFRKYADVKSSYFHGQTPRGERKKALEAPVVITTPEAALASGLFHFDAVVVDECHHAVGSDPLRQFLERFRGEYRLGLSAHIPSRHRRLIEQIIGPLRVWEWSDPEIRPYVAEWVADVYETPLGEAEKVYREIEARMQLSDPRERMVYRTALTFLARDGPLALKESLKRKTKLAALLEDLRKDVEALEDLHKLSALLRVLNEHEFDRAIVFVERVVIAKRVAEIVGGVALTGKNKEVALESVKKARIIVSTSAGEEGLDLPTADLLVVWSNTVSPLRLVQRRGRVLRKMGRIPKFLVFLVTPGTVDEDAFVEGIYLAKRAGVDVGVLEGLVERFGRSGTREKLLHMLEEPIPEDWLAELLGIPLSAVRRNLRILCESGEIVPVYTELGRAYIRSDALRALSEKRPEFFQPTDVEITFVVEGRKKKHVRPPVFVERVIVRERRGETEYVYVLSVGATIRDEETLNTLRRHWSTPLVFRTWG